MGVFSNQRGQVAPQVLLIGAAAAAIYFAGEGAIKGERWVVKKTRQGITKIFHKHQKPAQPPTTMPNLPKE